ncbi:MAG TPA: glycoside hydrolase family 172 protein, partial [Polyangiales bacterium]
AWPALIGLPVEIIELGPTAPQLRVAFGPAVVRELVVSKFDARDESLRSTRLILTVDGERAVDAPLGDLFGAGPGLAKYRSLATEMRPDALVLRWPMPVRESLTVSLQSTQRIPETTIQLRYESGVPPEARRFHARWTGGQTFSTRDAVDWTLLHVKGTGWYVGTLLNVDNSTALWWGEGDEKIFVDGEAFPSHFGTGTEDYFGQAWCSTDLVATPWVGQTRADGPINGGHSSNYRWHVPDAIPFVSELRFRLEVMHWLRGLFAFPVADDAVTYWYAEQGATTDARELETSEFRASALGGADASAGMPERTACRL